jgi:hypothetical protein
VIIACSSSSWVLRSAGDDCLSFLFRSGELFPTPALAHKSVFISFNEINGDQLLNSGKGKRDGG